MVGSVGFDITEVVDRVASCRNSRARNRCHYNSSNVLRLSTGEHRGNNDGRTSNQEIAGPDKVDDGK